MGPTLSSRATWGRWCESNRSPTLKTPLAIIWIKFASFMISWEPLGNFSGVLSQFHEALASLSLRGVLIVKKIVYVPSVEAQEERAAKRQRKAERKFEVARLAKEQIQHWVADGFSVVYTDGSAKWEPLVGWIGGYGCHEPGGREFAAHLPPQARQTVNRAELHAVIEVVHKLRHRLVKVAVAMDSSYVHGGLQGNALKWQARHWVTGRGSVINVDLWTELLSLLASSIATSVLVKVPSHVDIEGNDQADWLAEEGRKSSPLYTTVRRPVPHPHTPLRSPGTFPRSLMGSATPKTRVEPTPLLPSDDVTPMLLRSHGPREPTDEGDVAKRLFFPAEFSDPEAVDSDTASLSSRADSPRSESPLDFLTDSGDSHDDRLSDGFSTDVSSTRKRK